MSKLLWFVLGGVATAVSAGIAATMLDGEPEGDASDEAEESREDIALGDGSEEQPKGDGQVHLG